MLSKTALKRLLASEPGVRQIENYITTLRFANRLLNKVDNFKFIKTKTVRYTHLKILEALRHVHKTTMTTPATKAPINLIRGWPAPNLLPAERLKAASTAVLSDPEIFVPGLQYGPDPGYQPLREELARYLGGFFGVAPDPDRICITGGASQNVACLLQSFTDPAYTQAIWVVAPCYHLVCPIFEDAGFRRRLRSVPEDEEGISVECLEKGLKEFEDAQPEKPVNQVSYTYYASGADTKIDLQRARAGTQGL